MAPAGYLLLIAGWVLWIYPFVRMKRGRPPAVTVDARAKWGVILESAAYWLLLLNPFWRWQPGLWRVAASVVFLGLGCVLASSALKALGQQWRIEAGLNADHELVRTGPYRLVRHPIYLSMLCMLLGMGFIVTPYVQLAVATVVFLIGTEIRVRIEDSLLSSRFGDEFRNYQNRVPAYLPGLR